MVNKVKKILKVKCDWDNETAQYFSAFLGFVATNLVSIFYGQELVSLPFVGWENYILGILISLVVFVSSFLIFLVLITYFFVPKIVVEEEEKRQK